VTNTFQDFIGQARAKERLEIAVAAAKLKGEVLGHTLLIGSQGLGKAKLVSIIANSMGGKLNSTSGSAIENTGELTGLLANLEEGDMLFIDEIDNLKRRIAEDLEPVAKTFKLSVILNQEREVLLDLPRFTLIGTTTSKELLPAHLLSCFRIIGKLDPYSVHELATMACHFAKSMESEIDADVADRIARSADGTPLDVLNRLQHIRDYVHVKGSGTITAAVAEEALKMLLPANEPREANENRDAIPSEVRREVWRRDLGKCVRCGSREKLEYDHIIPVSKGGSNTARNIELLCEDCNRSKSDSIQ
jgi:Holliday junction DNA helicase RuvB